MIAKLVTFILITSLTEFAKYLPALVNKNRKYRISNIESKIIKKRGMACLKFWLSQKLEICLSLDIKICL